MGNCSCCNMDAAVVKLRNSLGTVKYLCGNCTDHYCGVWLLKQEFITWEIVKDDREGS